MNLPYAYAEGASVLLQGMIDRASASPGTANDLIPPYLYLWRHHIELKLKVILSTVANDASRWTAATGHAVASNLTSGNESTHSLLALWQRALPLVEIVLRKQQYDWPIAFMPLATVSSLVEQLHQIDPAGNGVRYDRRRNGNLTMLDVNRVDLEHAQANLYGIAEFLQWAHQEIGATMDVFPSKAQYEEQLRQQWEAMADDPDDER
jgi:hypothetical protein